MTEENVRDKIYHLKGKTIAVVYIFEGDNENGMNHFFIWKSKILAQWLVAIENLFCQPLIMDIRTFVEKAMSRTLPHIDYVLNLNSGTYDLSAMALIPSTCSILGIPCIPCSANTIIEGENKLFSNAIAKYDGLNVPKRLDFSNINGIFRPYNLGNSMGVKRGPVPANSQGIYQEFIAGYDITIPMIFNPLKGKQDFLPTLIYVPDNAKLDWFNGEEAKKKRSGYSFDRIKLSNKIKEKIINFVNDIQITSFCRIDARFRQNDVSSKQIPFCIDNPADFFFVEINVMPTIRPDNNFAYAFSLIDQESSLFTIIETINGIYNKCDIYMFLLVCSMLSPTTKTMY